MYSVQCALNVHSTRAAPPPGRTWPGCAAEQVITAGHHDTVDVGVLLYSGVYLKVQVQVLLGETHAEGATATGTIFELCNCRIYN